MRSSGINNPRWQPSLPLNAGRWLSDGCNSVAPQSLQVSYLEGYQTRKNTPSVEKTNLSATCPAALSSCYSVLSASSPALRLQSCGVPGLECSGSPGTCPRQNKGQQQTDKQAYHPRPQTAVRITAQISDSRHRSSSCGSVEETAGSTAGIRCTTRLPTRPAWISRAIH